RFLVDERRTVVPVGSAGERSQRARLGRYGAVRSNPERAAPLACVGKQFSAVRLSGIKSSGRAGKRGGAWVGRPRWLTILMITGGSSIAAMIFKAPQQLGKRSMLMSKTV